MYDYGAVSDYSQLKTAIETFLSSNGWTLEDGILFKGSAYFQFTTDANGIYLFGGLGKSGSTLTTKSTSGAKIAGISGNLISFPTNYEIHLFTNPDECYVFLNYNTDFYQNLEFGISDVAGLGVPGVWLDGSRNSNLSNASTTYGNMNVTTTNYRTFTSSYYFTGGFFLGTYYSPGQCYCDLDGSTNWRQCKSTAVGTGIVDQSHLSGLITALPNIFNQTTVLLPIKVIAYRNSNGRSIIANLNNARFCRNDNIDPGALITYGSEQWKVYPLYRKDINDRDASGYNAHSGTFAVAIKYTGA